jgi:HEAT repeat protein
VQPVDADFKVKVDARSTLTLAPEDLWLESLQDEETVTMVPGADMPIAGGHTRVELRLLERGSDPSLEEAFAARRPALLSQPLASPLRDSPQDPNDPYRQVLAGRTLSDFARLLRELPEEQKARDDALSQALTGLQALFVVEPASAAKVSGLLRSGLSHDAVSTIHGALSGVQTREALRALSQIMDDSQLAPEVREDAAEAMNLVEAPTEENIAVLWRLAWGSNAALCQTAILALGTSAMHLQKQDARAAEAMVDEMSRALGAAHGEEAQNVWLGALGNTRSPRALPVVKPFLIVSSVAIRSTATLSLRFMPAPEADRLLSERLLSDDAVKVRSAAVFAASYRPLAPLLPTFERALRADREPVVRKDLVHLLGAQVDSSPEARSLLTWSSQKDPDASVRDGAAKVLARPPLRKGAARSVDDGSRRPGGAAFNAPSNELTELGASK